MKNLFKIKKLAFLSVALLATSVTANAHPAHLDMAEDIQPMNASTTSVARISKSFAHLGKTSSQFDVIKGEMKKAAGVFVGVATGMEMMQRVQAGRLNQYTETDVLMPIGSAGIAQLASSYALGELSWSELPKYGTTVLGMVVGGSLGQAAATCMQASDESRDAFLQYGAAMGASAGYLTGSALLGTARAATRFFSSFWSTTEVEQMTEASLAVNPPVVSPHTLVTPPCLDKGEEAEVLTGDAVSTENLVKSSKVQTVSLDGTFEIQKKFIQHEPLALGERELKRKRLDANTLTFPTVLNSMSMSIKHRDMTVIHEDSAAHKVLTNEIFIAANEVSKSLKGLFSLMGY